MDDVPPAKILPVSLLENMITASIIRIMKDQNLLKTWNVFYKIKIKVKIIIIKIYTKKIIIFEH